VNLKEPRAKCDCRIVLVVFVLGHFPMSENPKEFLKHLLPVLGKIGNR
jgi:hypothetical protein